MLFWFLPSTRLSNLLDGLVHLCLNWLVTFCFLISLCYYLGWIERWVWWKMEDEASIILNRTKVTIGSFKLDFTEVLQGKLTVQISNVIVHTPHRKEWGWSSPVVARIGHVKVECNAIITILHLVLFKREVPIELYTCILSDIQVFVERHESVFNLYLLDPCCVLPSPPFLNGNNNNNNNGNDGNDFNDMNQTDTTTIKTERDTVDETRIDSVPSSSTTTSSSNSSSNSTTTTSTGSPNSKHITTKTTSTGDDHDGNNNNNNKHQERAQQLVNQMVESVESIGRAAKHGGSLTKVIRQHGLELADKIRENLVSNNTDKNNNRTGGGGGNGIGHVGIVDAKQKLEEGVNVLRTVGKVAVNSLNSTTSLVRPERIVTKSKPPPLCRVGRVCVKDARIFTKDSWIQLQQQQQQQQQQHDNNTTNATTIMNNKSGWNKPIVIQSLVVRAAEMCPPMSLKDDDDLPAVYQTIDKVLDILWRRLLAEIAKSNAGRLFSTAMFEGLNLMKSNTTTVTATTTTTTTNIHNNNNNSDAVVT